ncbi:MAG: hypothetical protein QM535_13910 [Limnohabitans sp.]|nr:hypothetical protein [Limnohabitans sp.]
MITSIFENTISKDKNILLVLIDKENIPSEINYLIENFCGNVIYDTAALPEASNIRLFVCGDISKFNSADNHIYIIEEFATNYEMTKLNFKSITLGQVPLIVHNAGVYYRQLFDDLDLFEKVKSEHCFQELTESTKESTSFRKGIYLTEIEKEDIDNAEVLHFRLLRCSSNLTGPTDNFRKTDHTIMSKLNNCVAYDFENNVQLNHVLAQIYENKQYENKKQVKAKIKAHSDKTKDMPKEGLIAFCTFYDTANLSELKQSKTDRYDWCYKETSGLTRLHFKLKKSILDESLAKEFTVTLYPNSAFVIPLSTNRFYTHEIKPSVLDVDKIPTRMGYVARCSNVDAVFKNNQTYIKENGELVKLEQMTAEMLADLRNSYYQENVSEEIVNYGKIHFSMNTGDYERPLF